MARPKADPATMKPLREAVRRRIAELGITQAEAAERIGVDRRLLTHWQNHLKTMPDPSQFQRLVEGLEMDPMEMLRGLGYLKKGDSLTSSEHKQSFR